VVSTKEGVTMAYQYLSRGLARTGVLAWIIFALAAILACSGPAVTPAPVTAIAPTAYPATQTLETVRSGSAGALGEAGQQLAQSQGYFAQEGIAIDFFKVDASTVVTTLITGQVDVQGLGLEVGLFNAMLRGVEFRIVATQASSEPNANGQFFVVRKDLIDTGRIRSDADLKGLRIAVPSRGSSPAYVVARAMEAGGLTLNDAQLVELGFPAMVAALSSQGIDVAILPEPLATVAVQNGSGLKWKGLADVVPGFQQSVVVFTPQFAAQRDLATRWTTAYLRGIRDYNDAFRKNQHRPETVQALAAAFVIKPTVFDGMGFMHINPDGKVNLASIQDLMNWYVQMGYLSEPVDLTRVVDPSFVDAALAKLGAYQ
jgi:NitT/TauT family transport system substrate-binding protein